MREYVKSFDGTKYMSFLMEDSEFLTKDDKIWKSAIVLKQNI